MLVGAEGAAQAYLYSLDGSLLTIFSMPDASAVSFGAALVAVGNDRVLIGAYSYEVGVSQVGRAYLFDTNGVLLTTFTNPSPKSVQAFGFSVASVGSDRVLIGSGGGGPFLFRCQRHVAKDLHQTHSRRLQQLRHVDGGRGK